MKVPAIAAALALLLAAEAAAQQQQPQQQPVSYGAKYRAWQASIDGDISDSAPAFTGTELDVGSRLDVDDDEILHDVTIWGAFPMVGNARINYWWGSFEGESTNTTACTWDSVVFPIGATIETDIDVTGMSLSWDYPLAQQLVGMGYIEAAAQLGYSFYSIQSEISGNAGSGEATVRAPMISVGARVFAQLASWLYTDIQGTIRMYELDDNVDTDYWEINAELMVNPFSTLYIGIGYRVVHLEAEDKRDGSDNAREFNAEIDGFFLSVTYHF
ncbi:MAG: porin family protein [Planctomycetota bacterium]|jgi:hypothetical protein